MDSKFKFTAEESTFVVEAEGRRLRVSYEEVALPHKKAMTWCKKHGGGDETVDNLRLLAKYRSQINEELAALGKDKIASWMWSNETCYHNARCAFVVGMSLGDVYCLKHSDYCVRAVSEFRMITMNAVYNISLDELFEAYWTCRRKKSRSRAASLFEADYEHNLIELREEINAGIYAPRASRAFVITRPDVREIFAADFRDRVVHTWIAQRVEPLL